MTVTGAQIVIHLLERLGVTVVAGIPGGAILPLYDAMAASGIRHVLARHEQGAGFIAQGLARAGGRAGVCLATSGPGATNLVTALADAKADSVPLVAITANVPRALMGTDAFQEVDFFSLAMPVTKHGFLVEDAADLFRVLPEAFRLAESPRPGPVSVDIPKDVLTAEIEIPAWPDSLVFPVTAPWADGPDGEWLDEVVAAVAAAERPVIYAGGGAGRAWERVRALARREGIPVAVTLMGLGILEPGDPLFLGMLGMHGEPAANRAMADADLVLALGVRFDDRATGKVAAFCPNARVIHVDIDAAELGKNHRTDWSWAGDTAEFLEALLSRPTIRPSVSGFDPAPVLRSLADAVGDALVATDVGQHQMWAAQYFPVRRPGMFLTSGGLGTMGFGLPTAIGAALASPGRRVVCVTGDGSLLMNVQEMATLAELGLPVMIVLFNNGGLGLVRQQQELFYSETFVASGFAGGPDFCALARAFGLKAWRADETGLARAFAEAAAHQGPSLVEVPVAARTLALPMVAPGDANIDAVTARREE